MKENWKKLGIKHLVECHCTLKIYTGSDNHLFHKFPVYSLIDKKTGGIVPRHAQCNNCSTIHKVVDICKSEIIKSGKDTNSSSVSIEDISFQIDSKICNVLTKYNCDISTWEHALDIIENEAWQFPLVISRDLIENVYNVKILSILSDNKFKILSKKIEDEINLS
jgi:hypothetical protein